MASIRVARASDIDAIVHLWTFAAGPTRIASDRGIVERLVAHDPDALIVAADDGGVIVGTVVVGWDGWRCHLYRMAVHPDHRRRRIGNTLLTAARDRAVAVGAVRIDALVDDSNELGKTFWRAAGFELDENDRRWIQPV